MKTMKLALAGLMIFGLGAATVNAQDKAAANQKSTTTTTEKKKPATAASTDKTKPATNTSGQHLKKDGTPDMRYKENKQAAASGDKKTDTKKAPAKSSPNDKPTKAVKQAGSSGKGAK